MKPGKFGGSLSDLPRMLLPQNENSYSFGEFESLKTLKAQPRILASLGFLVTPQSGMLRCGGGDVVFLARRVWECRHGSFSQR